MTRRERLYPEIKRLREVEGLMWREIGERLGLSLKTVHDYYAYPTHEADRARRERYTGTCVECGGRTNNGGAASGPPERCTDCLNPAWTREAVLDAFRDWGDDHGGIPPREADVRPGAEGHGCLPHENTVAKLFGSWNPGLLAAGYALHKDRRPETTQAMADAVRAGESTAAIADRFGCTAANVHGRLKQAGLRVSELRRAA
jgi:hypothetical protein